jgi:hypothetical protein
MLAGWANPASIHFRSFCVVAIYVPLSTIPGTPSLSPDPGFDYYYKVCRKGDPEQTAVAVSYSPMGVPADAGEITSLPRDWLFWKNGVEIRKLF